MCDSTVAVSKSVTYASIRVRTGWIVFALGQFVRVLSLRRAIHRPSGKVDQIGKVVNKTKQNKKLEINNMFGLRARGTE